MTSMLQNDLNHLQSPTMDFLSNGHDGQAAGNTGHTSAALGDVEMSEFSKRQQQQQPQPHSILHEQQQHQQHHAQPPPMEESNPDYNHHHIDAPSEWAAQNKSMHEYTYNTITRRDKYVFVISVISMICITIIGVVVAVKKHNDKNKSDPVLKLYGPITIDPITGETKSAYVLPQRPNTTMITNQDELDIILNELSMNTVLSDKVAGIPTTVDALLTSTVDSSDPYVLGATWVTNVDGFNGKEHTIVRYALAVLYYATNGTQWYNSTNWLSNEYYCNWHGVVCCEDVPATVACNSSEFGKIIELDLYKNNLIGMIPNVLSLFTELRSIYISENSLYGTIPGSAFLSLSNLGNLYASYNFLTGTIPLELRTTGTLSKFGVLIFVILCFVSHCIDSNVLVVYILIFYSSFFHFERNNVFTCQ
jgi:hypothetical protein